MEKPLGDNQYTKFGGMVSVVDPHDTPAGQATLQINGMATRPGELNVRQGLKEVSFEVE